MGQNIRRVASFCALLVIAGCGGSEVETAFTTRSDALAAQRTAAFNAGIQDTDTLPTSGSASYSGLTQLELDVTGDDDRSLIGDITFDVSFAAADGSSFDATATNFTDANDGAYTGVLLLSNGTIYRLTGPTAGTTLDGIMDGQLTGPNGEILQVDAVLVGDFYGANWQYLVGDVSGTADLDGLNASVDGTFSSEISSP